MTATAPTRPRWGGVDNLGRVNLDIALRFAATEIDGLTPSQIEQLLGVFFRYLSRCPYCDDSGVVKAERDIEMYEDNNGRGEQHVIPKGSIGPCPRCGAPNRGDPSWVQWCCKAGLPPSEFCAEGSRPTAAHEGCGYRIVLPLDLFD